jgi:SAM-dependent methyltransferase
MREAPSWPTSRAIASCINRCGACHATTPDLLVPLNQTMSTVIDPKKPLIHQIEAVANTIPGWTPIDQLFTLYSLSVASADVGGDILEIGSWCGRSAAILALAARATPGTHVVAIDLFPAKDDWSENADGSYSFKVKLPQVGEIGGYQEQTVWKEPFERDIAPIYAKYNSVYDVFVESMQKHGLSNLVTAHRGDAGVISGLAGFKARLAFIDGDHSYDAVCRDIAQVEKVLLPGGWICFDDAFSHYDGVNRAIEDKIIGSGQYELCQQMTRKLFVARRRGA